MADYLNKRTVVRRVRQGNTSSAPVATGGTVQPASPRGPLKPKKVPVKGHTRTSPTSNKTPAIDPTTQNLLNAAVRLRFSGQEQALQQQQQANARFQSGVPAWYQQARSEIQGIAGQSAAQGQQNLQQIQAYNSQPSGTGSAESQQAAQARNNLNSEYGAMVGRDSQANQDFLSRLQAAMVTQQGNTLNAANRDAQTIRQNQGALKGQEGDFKTTYLANQQAAQSKADVENKKIQASLLIAQGKTDMAAQVLGSLNQDRNAKNNIARTNARTQRIQARNTKMKADRSYKLDLKKFGVATAKDNYQKQHGLGPYKAGNSGGSSDGTYSKSKLQGFDEKWNYAQATAVQLFHKGNYTDKQTKTTQPISVDVAYGALLGSTKDPDISRAAALLAFGKPLPAGLRHRLAVKGIHVRDPAVKPAKGGGPYGTGRMP